MEFPLDTKSLSLYANQVGGHGVLIKPIGTQFILKKFDDAEHAFYGACSRGDSAFSMFMEYIPRYFGKIELKKELLNLSSEGTDLTSCKTVNSIEEKNNSSTSSMPTVSLGRSCDYMVLEDLAYGLKKPCILDLKMGLKQRCVCKSSEKKIHSKLMKSLNTTSHTLGFRLGGAQIYNSNSDGVIFYNKYFGRQQNTQGTYEVLHNYFYKGIEDPVQRKTVIESFIGKLNALREIIQSLPGIRLWSGSLLFIYDSAASLKSEQFNQTEDNTPPPCVIMKMIDFANFTMIDPCHGIDDEYIYGMNSVISFLYAILNNNFQRIETMATSPPDPKKQDQELAVAIERHHISKNKIS